MNGTTPDIALDVDRWARAKYWTWEETEYLLAGIDHWKVLHVSPSVELDLRDEERKRIREALRFHFRLEASPERVSPDEALDIARRARIPISETLERAVEEATKTIGASKSAAKPNENPVGLLRKHNKLLKVFLAIAVKQYGYDPTSRRQDAIVRIRNDAEVLGIKIDDETIRRRLIEAREELDAQEETGLEGN